MTAPLIERIESMLRAVPGAVGAGVARTEPRETLVAVRAPDSPADGLTEALVARANVAHAHLVATHAALGDLPPAGWLLTGAGHALVCAPLDHAHLLVVVLRERGADGLARAIIDARARAILEALTSIFEPPPD